MHLDNTCLAGRIFFVIVLLYLRVTVVAGGSGYYNEAIVLSVTGKILYSAKLI